MNPHDEAKIEEWDDDDEIWPNEGKWNKILQKRDREFLALEEILAVWGPNLFKDIK